MFSTSIPETSMISKGICTLTIDCLESSKLKSWFAVCGEFARTIIQRATQFVLKHRNQYYTFSVHYVNIISRFIHLDGI